MSQPRMADEFDALERAAEAGLRPGGAGGGGAKVPRIGASDPFEGSGVAPIGTCIATGRVWRRAYCSRDTCMLHDSTFGGNAPAFTGASADPWVSGGVPGVELAELPAM